jgi:hypothetical protein
MGLVRTLLKDIEQILGRRYYAPRPWERGPVGISYHVREAGDTGGGWYRPSHRKQDPSVDPAEPKNESSSVGNDHGWSNCTMTSGAMALDFHTQGALKKWGGDLRHKQGDLSGGTDLYDVRDAWAALGETLTIRIGAGWEALTEDRADGRFLIVQGEGNVPGSESFTGGHGCVVGPESDSQGRWLFGDPLASGWQWIDRNAIKSWMQQWHSGFAYAITAAHPPAAQSTPPPSSSPPPEPDCPDCPPYVKLDAILSGAEAKAVAVERDRAITEHVHWLREPKPDWNSSIWGDGAWDVTTWHRGPIPSPVADAEEALVSPNTWDKAQWSQSLWQ